MDMTKIIKSAMEILTIYKVHKFYEALHIEFTEDKDEQANESLKLLEENPEDGKLKAALEDILVKKAEDDKGFAVKLVQLVHEFYPPMDNLTGGAPGHGYGGARGWAGSRTWSNGHGGVPRGAIPYLGEVFHSSLTSATVSPKPIMLVRYPNLECPDKVPLNLKFCLLVQLLIKPLGSDSHPFFFEMFNQPPEVELVIYAKGFDIEGSHHKVLKVDIKNDSDDFFVLTPRELGEQQISVDFYQYGKYIGTQRRNVLVAVTNQSVVNEFKQPESSGALQLKPEPKGDSQDLEIRVRLDNKDNRTLNFELYTDHPWIVNPMTGEEIGYHHERFGPVSLNVSPEEMIKAMCDEMSLMSCEPGIDAEQRMAAIGNELWDVLIPPDLKTEYWKFKDHVKSMLITSDEPWIPWEMIKPYRYKDDSYEKDEDLFWCQKFELSRWIAGRDPAYELPIGIAQPVAPVTTDLPAVQEEVTFIEQLGNLNPNITGFAPLSDKAYILNFLEHCKFSLLHFASHCEFDATNPNDSGIQLSNGSLRPSDIHIEIKRSRPLIFLNVCKGAQLGFSFTGLGGWAYRLVREVKVGAFAGAMWKVNDALALMFAKRFYTALLQERQTIAQAFRIARETVRKAAPANATWLAYVLYADPGARVGDATMSPSDVVLKSCDEIECNTIMNLNKEEKIMKTKAKWTYMVYMAGDNNLSAAGDEDLNELRQVGSSSDVNVLVQLDNTKEGTRRFLIQREGINEKVECLGPTDAGDPQVLMDFIAWSHKNYPADRYALILWNHGGGWKPGDLDKLAKKVGTRDWNTREASTKSALKLKKTFFRTSIIEILNLDSQKAREICCDDGSGNSLDTIELGKVLAYAKEKIEQPLDILGMDACLMSNLEVAYQAEPYVKYIVASEQTEPNAGWPYKAILDILVNNPEISTPDFCCEIVKAYTNSYKDLYESNPESDDYKVTQSAFDLSRVKDTTKSVDILAKALIGQTPGIRLTIQDAQRASARFCYDTLWDVSHFCKELSGLTQDNNVNNAAQKVVKEFEPNSEKFIIAESHLGENYDQCCGVSIYLPSSIINNVLKYYADLEFAKDLNWYLLLQKL